MRKVTLFSALLIAGLAASQLIGRIGLDAHHPLFFALEAITMTLLGFIMIHVGYEFEIDRAQVRAYGLDALVATTAAAFPWVFCTFYFLLVLGPDGALTDLDAWRGSLLAGLFAAPTSAGVLFSMLAAAGLSATWVFRKARVLAIFDDLVTVLLMIPLKMLLVGVRWQLVLVVAVMFLLLWAAWKHMRRLHAPVTWAWVLGYAAAITVASEAIYRASKLIDSAVPIHIEILLPAFALGCMLARPRGADPHRDDAREGHQDGPESPGEQRVSTTISAVFMVMVGLSMPAIDLAEAGLSAGTLLAHALALTVLSNLGKMFILLFYRREVSLRERLATSIAMWPRGEVGAGILVLAVGYGIGGAMVAVASLSLALNLVGTGVFIAVVKKLLAGGPDAAVRAARGA